MKVLDIGCGTGIQLAYYQGDGCEVYGIDLSRSMLQGARNNLSHGEGLIEGDALELPFKDGVFDLVLSSLFLHQLDPHLRSIVLEDVCRILQPKGRILLTDFHPRANDSVTVAITGFLISAVELAAGWRHYSNSRDFLSRGGIPFLAEDHHLEVRKKVIVGNGNLAIYLLAPIN